MNYCRRRRPQWEFCLADAPTPPLSRWTSGRRRVFRGPSPGTVDSRKKALVEAAARQSTAACNRPRTCHTNKHSVGRPREEGPGVVPLLSSLRRGRRRRPKRVASARTAPDAPPRRRRPSDQTASRRRADSIVGAMTLS